MDSMEALEPQPDPEIPDGGGTEAEDIPSDFFDEFSKEEFIEGLSIIDSWVDGIPDSGRPKDSSKPDMISASSPNEKKIKSSGSPSQLDEFIRPGSRRDPSKTNEAIKKDKEVKLKEYLAKSLESSDDLRPPGTELDGYFDDAKLPKKDKTEEKDRETGPQPVSPSRVRHTRESPVRFSHRGRDSPLKPVYQTRQRQRSPRRSPRHSPRRSPRHSPRRSSPIRRSPYRRPQMAIYPQWRPNSPHGLPSRPGNMYRRQYSPSRRSPRRMSPRRTSPRRTSPRRSPRKSPRRSPRKSPRRSPRKSPRRSPRKSPRRSRRSRSRSPYKRSRHSRSRSPLPKMNTDRFLYPADSDLPPRYDPAPTAEPYPPPSPFSGPLPGGPSYSFGPSYNYNSNSSYEYGGLQPLPSGVAPPSLVAGPQASAPVQLPHPVTVTHIPMPPNPVPAPVMVPAPNLISPSLPKPPPSIHSADTQNPYDALAKLVAEGKISQADYLKLAPNKGTSTAAETNHRVLVLQRCNSALLKLDNLHLPSHLVMTDLVSGQADPKYIAPSFCSPLKRQAPIEFLFTKANVSAVAQQNKHLVDSIIASLPELQKVVTRGKKKTPKNMKDAAVQTYKPFCDVCEIRENTQFHEASTSIDSGHFCTTVHTQVMEQDLMNSKSVFAPSGSVGDGAQMSIAHLTPAQLVSQLAARAKTLKQSDFPPSSQYQRNSPNNYDYESRGGQQYQNYNNYRY